MKNIVIQSISIFITLILISCDNKTIEYNKELENIQSLNGLIYFHDKLYSGKIIYNYPNSSQTKSILTYQDGEKNGEHLNYYEKGQLKSKSNYKNEQLDGNFISYYENGGLDSKLFYKNGEVIEEKFYYDLINSPIELFSLHKDGVESYHILYYESGRVRQLKFLTEEKEVEYYIYFDRKKSPLKYYTICGNKGLTYMENCSPKGKLISIKNIKHEEKSTLIEDIDFDYNGLFKKRKLNTINIKDVLFGCESKSRELRDYEDAAVEAIEFVE